MSNAVITSNKIEVMYQAKSPAAITAIKIEVMHPNTSVVVPRRSVVIIT